MPNEYYCDPLEGKLRQGDIFTCGSHIYLDSDPSSALLGHGQETKISATCYGLPALVLNHDCEIAGGKSSKRVVICPIKPLADLESERRGHAKRGRIANLFFLPRYKNRLEDSVANLSQLTTVHTDNLQLVNRIATLDVMGRKALYAQTLRWLSRWVLAELKCPNCETIFDPAGLQTRSPHDP